MAVAVSYAPRITSDPFVLSARNDHANTTQTSSATPRPFVQYNCAPLAMSSAAMSKKAKGKKVANDPNETSKLLAAKISQLEQDAAGEKDQEAEIGA